MKKLTLGFLTITGIVGVLLCCSGQHTDIETQLIQNVSGVVILAVSSILARIIRGY